MQLLISLLVAGGVMGLMDFIWLGFLAKKLYFNEMGQILLKEFNMVPALIFYVIYVVGIVIFVINPALDKNSLSHAAIYGALFGLVAYATYDLTSLAVIKGFSTKIVVIDMLWGMLITSSVATITYLIIQKLGL
ncbi:DUF2177 family protein [Candidatus Saccharibacteria bacterium]|jgi:uncharacterized membrane protein|nr:DUF2177 family protein [Candidatus Saccharibacteria bacterium]